VFIINTFKRITVLVSDLHHIIKTLIS